MENFPFRTLIWAILLAFVLWVFREPLAEPFRNMEEIEVLGQFKLKVKKSDLKALEKAEISYKAELATLQNEIVTQESIVSQMKIKMDKLLEDVKGCDKAQEAAKILNKEFIEMKSGSSKILNDARILDNIKVFKTLNIQSIKKTK